MNKSIDLTHFNIFRIYLIYYTETVVEMIHEPQI